MASKFYCDNNIFERTDLTPAEKLTYIYFRRRANKRGESWPRYSTIARDCGFSRRHAIRVVNKLVELGLVVRVHRATEKGDPTSNLYIVEPLKASNGGNVTTQVTRRHPKDKKHISNRRTGHDRDQRKEMILELYLS